MVRRLPVIDADQSSLLNLYSDTVNRAIIFSVSVPQSVLMFHAMPVSSCGLRLADEALRVAVGLRLGSAYLSVWLMG